LVGTVAELNQQQGTAVALSADGNTAIVGGNSFYRINYGGGPPGGIGAAWVFTRNAGTWSQQGRKLVGSGASPEDLQGTSVSLAADGNTAVVGGPADSRKGAAWVWTRQGGFWTQQSKLVGSGAVNGNGVYGSGQGFSVSVSSDGNTIVIGGPLDSSVGGAAWVWIRSAGSWTEQGKLVASGALGKAAQGSSVSLSADGNTLIVGGSGDNNYNGASWIWTRDAGTWTQVAKLVGSEDSSPFLYPEQGVSASIAADGKTAIVGGRFGIAWVWIRNGGLWIQQGPALIGSGAASLSSDGNTALIGTTIWTRSDGVWVKQPNGLTVSGASGSAEQGYSAALSADGRTAIIGGPSDSNDTGAAWVFVLDPASIPTRSWWTLMTLVIMLALIGLARSRG
jgi:hypothetical protein